MVQTRKVFQTACLILPAQWKSFFKSWWSWHLYTNSSRFLSTNFKNFHAIFNNPLYPSYFLSFFDKFLYLIIEFSGNFSGFIGYHKIENFKIIFRKNSEILVKYVQFFESFRRKNGFFGQEECWYFWKMDSSF